MNATTSKVNPVNQTSQSTFHSGGIAILDYGSQYTQLIARRVREQGVYAELFPWNADLAQVLALQPGGVILSGVPNSVYYPVMFHQVVPHPPFGAIFLLTFVVVFGGGPASWTPASIIDESVTAIQTQIGDGRVVLGLSGGVDSAVAAALIHKAVGKQ